MSRPRSLQLAPTLIVAMSWLSAGGKLAAADDSVYGDVAPPLVIPEAQITPIGATAPAGQPLVRTNELSELQGEKIQHFQQVQRQIEELGRRWNARSRVVEPAPHPNEHPDPHDTPAVAATPAAESPADPSHAPPDASGEPHILVVSDVVVDNVDRLALADTLLASGNVAEALGVYTELVKGGQVKADDPWLLFQLAACDRRLGKLDEASDKYRRVVAAEQPEWLIPLARWWLAAIEDRERLTSNSVKLGDLLQQLDALVTNELKTGPGPTAAADPAPRQ
jgi:tetratricopeptide (TPR) repeat protein